MIHETMTQLPAAEVLRRAKVFFPERVPHHAAFLEREGPTFAIFRGQGGEELALAAVPGEGGTRVRASSSFFDQTIGRFFSTLPASNQQPGAA